MSKSHALSFSRVPAVVLYEEERDNMWSSWQDYIIATRTKQGAFTVLARKYGDEFLDGSTKQKWFLIHKVTNIKNPQEFFKAVTACEFELSVDVFWEDVISADKELDENFSKALGDFVNLQIN